MTELLVTTMRMMYFIRLSCPSWLAISHTDVRHQISTVESNRSGWKRQSPLWCGWHRSAGALLESLCCGVAAGNRKNTTNNTVSVVETKIVLTKIFVFTYTILFSCHSLFSLAGLKTSANSGVTTGCDQGLYLTELNYFDVYILVSGLEFGSFFIKDVGSADSFIRSILVPYESKRICYGSSPYSKNLSTPLARMVETENFDRLKFPAISPKIHFIYDFIYVKIRFIAYCIVQNVA